MLKYMLDTNICIFTIKNRPQQLREAFNRFHDKLCISSVSLMELIYGAEKSAHPEKNLAVVEGFAARLKVLPYDEPAANQTGQLRAELARSGTPIGPYDQLLAGHARSRGLIMVTNNRREFDRVPGLRVEDWTD
ncbi:tRNA(fMet)-specific endonuclease VapC [Ochrobactrum sp. RC6B]|uniref:Ribonuclease VapC n=2 Tax=Brucella intermedia TaxID=94625 RepID=A0ABR6ATL1_9HYPH|nr:MULTISPECIES: tRNA(fMet)-specific endonuclease VapC [Brucella/Ochrobactrum group]KAB2707397.1 tRNA(fMet)-specific endonuclease VapC [Brucella intermedia]MBA8852794.1 tRNA(fMet)-specific endonuclease VapC [Brucella intermedia]MBB3217281.1 tRNA(fMet)-specific endonuclease VapC [Ochrobactrum sp. RC6B]MDH0125950.1 tRNA(fMet)-specific endonuclease VapC [Brucella intermedia GD04153]NYD80426.1 tRNA(fMet)-specific endonuclease VapC [Brucella intermedia]